MSDNDNREYVENMREIARLAEHFKVASRRAEDSVGKGRLDVDRETLKWSRKTLAKMRKLWDEVF